MHVTLHLTSGCNMDCRYCYVDRQHIQTMTPETARAAAEVISLPVHPSLSEADLDRIVTAVNTVAAAGA